MLNSYLSTLTSKVSSESWYSLSERLSKLETDQLKYVINTPLKNPNVALILSILLGQIGADRFYLGQNDRGIVKLALNLLSWSICNILTFFPFGFWMNPFPFVFMFVINIGSMAYTIRDWFIITSATKEVNFERINSAINKSNNMYKKEMNIC